MDDQDIDNLKQKYTLYLCIALEQNNTDRVASLIEPFMQEAATLGLDKATATGLFKQLVTNAYQMHQKNKENEAARKQEEETAERTNRRVLLISSVITILIAIGFFILITKTSKESFSWVNAVLVTLFASSTIFLGIKWLVYKIDTFFQEQKSWEELSKQLRENKNWVWHCQRCQATYEYNGEADAICSRCNNRLIKVRGMRL